MASPPTHHKCEGILGMDVSAGNFDGTSLDGVKFAVAYHWPGPLHEGNGTVKPYFDPSTSEEQMNALGQILTGQAGGSWFEVLASIVTDVKQPAVVPLDFNFSGRSAQIKIGNAVQNDYGPIKNPVTGDEETVIIKIPGGMEYSQNDGEAQVVRSDVLKSTDEIAFDYEGSHTSYVEEQTFGSHR